MSSQTDGTSTLHHHMHLLRQDTAQIEHYGDAVDALIAALDELRDPEGESPEHAEIDAFLRRLILQPIGGLHQLNARVCHLVNSGVSQTAQHLVSTLRAPLLDLVGALDELPEDAQRRVVLCAVTMRAFTQDWLDQQQISALHTTYFARFEPDDLSLPYSVIFSPEIFGQNQRDLIDRFMPRGYLESDEGLGTYHLLLLAWLSGNNPFAGPVGLGDIAARTDLTDPHQAAALRSLGLRFGAEGPALKEALPALADAPQMTRHGARAAGHTKLDHKFYQMAQAGMNRARIGLPFLAPFARKPKVALCLSGQLRGFETALSTWKARLLPLIEPHFFVHSWYGIGRSGAEPFRNVLPFEGTHFSDAYRQIGTALGYAAMQERYPSLFARLTAGGLISEAQVGAIYETDHVILEDDKAGRFTDFSNQQKMHYKINAAHELARAAGEYDLMMRIRPDLSLRDIGCGMSDLLSVARSGPVLFAEKGFGVHYGGLMIGDQCALATPEIMQSYADTWSLYPALSAMGFAKAPPEFTGHVSLAQTCWLSGLDVRRAPIRFGQLNEARRLSAPDCLAALEADSTGQAQDLQLIAAARADL